jgi:ribosomal protein S18 acetylase RimI-like enzyme
MGEVVETRRARVEDCAGLAEVQIDSYRTAYAGFFPQSYLDRFTYEEQEKDWHDLLSIGLEAVLYVAESDVGEMVGYALGRPGPSDIPPYDGELVALHIHHSHQRQGIGHQLIMAVARHLKQLGCTSLMLWVLEENPARALYERLGGQVIGDRDWGGNDQFGVEVKEVAYGWSNIERLGAPRETATALPSS